jgi:hypothetical protein
VGELTIERVFEQSAIRRGRQATSPVFFVQTEEARWRFRRRKDAQRFINRGASCHEHEAFCCPHCFGSKQAWIKATSPIRSEDPR